MVFFLLFFFKFHFITAYKSKKNTKNYPTEGTVYPPHYPYEKFTVTPLFIGSRPQNVKYSA